MRPTWLNGLETLSSTGESTVVGIAIGVTDRNVPLIHSGVLYNDPMEDPRILHLAFHAIVKDEPLPDANCLYYWVRLHIDNDRAATLAGFCRRIAKRRPRIPYGIVYEGGRLADDGTAELSGRQVGLTCATFVLAVLKHAGYDMLDLGTWPPREGDDVWHAHIVKLLIRFHCRNQDLLTADHIVAVARERGCARFRPEEVAAACAQTQWPVTFTQVAPEGDMARTFLLSA
jgi:hypothetical protein